MRPSADLRRAVAWVKDDPFGVEFAELTVADGRLFATGVAIGTAPVAYRLDYELETHSGYVTAELHATSRGERWYRELVLRRDEIGVWSITSDQDGDVDIAAAGGHTATLGDALDCDLALSPVTNMMPILRHGLHEGGGPIDFVMAWVDVPALSVHADAQRYRHLRSAADHHLVRYEAIDGSFAADVTLDADAVVIDYPTIARRLVSARSGRPGSLIRRDTQ
jgi:hypothetical protein